MSTAPGRWPANVVFSHSAACGPIEAPGPCVDGCPILELDQQSGIRRSSGVYEGDGSRRPGDHATDFGGGHRPAVMYADSGGASRFYATFRYSTADLDTPTLLGTPPPVPAPPRRPQVPDAPHYSDDLVTLYGGDCLDVLRSLPDESIEAVVCDPPYGLSDIKPDAVVAALTAWAQGDREHVPDSRGFMNRAWDAFVPPPAVWDECLRVLRPGGHLLAFAGSRTADLMGLSVRLAGFEIRDSVMWIYGSGFPKSLSVHKATLNRVRSRYAEATCDCLDVRDGRTPRDDAGQGSGGQVWVRRGTGEVPPEATGDRDLPVHQGSGEDPVRELRGDGRASVAGPASVEAPVLLDNLCSGRTEAPGLGHAPVRAGLEEHPSEGPAAGSGLPGLRDTSDGRGSARPSPEALPVRRDEPAVEPGGAVRLVPPHDRGSDDVHPGVDPDRRAARRVHLDDHGGRQDAVARICSWCGLPDREWLDGLSPLGSALKPAHEPIIVARKPLAGTVAANVMEHGTGALNVDACRVGTSKSVPASPRRAPQGPAYGDLSKDPGTGSGWDPNVGRWPANVVLSHGECVEGGPCVDSCPVAEMDRQSGTQRSSATGTAGGRGQGAETYAQDAYTPAMQRTERPAYGDKGGASRYFPVFRYQAKAPASERPKIDGKGWPTVKPLALMRWLVRLVTPPGGTVLEPFAGSGTTVEAAMLEGFHVVAVERDPFAYQLTLQRIERANTTLAAQATAAEKAAEPTTGTLFDVA